MTSTACSEPQVTTTHLHSPHATNPWHVTGPGGMRVALTIKEVNDGPTGVVFELSELSSVGCHLTADRRELKQLTDDSPRKVLDFCNFSNF